MEDQLENDEEEVEVILTVKTLDKANHRRYRKESMRDMLR